MTPHQFGVAPANVVKRNGCKPRDSNHIIEIRLGLFTNYDVPESPVGEKAQHFATRYITLQIQSYEGVEQI
jgi:hypothetical protein